MLTPKISGLLDNALAHIGVPEMLKAFSYFMLEEEKTIHPPNPELDRYKKEYEILKKKFAQFYQLDNLTWRKLFNVLTIDIKSNNTAAQYMLGPVLREFMRDRIPDAKAKTLVCNIQSNGKYRALDEKSASHFLYRPLGINLEAYELPATNDMIDSELDLHGYQTPNKLGVKGAPFTIKIYNDELGHWERVPQSLIAQTIDDRDSMPSPIHAAMNYAQANDKKATETGLIDLKKAVRTMINTPTRLIPDAKIDIDHEKALAVAEFNVQDIKDEQGAKNVRNEILTLFANERNGFFKVKEDDKSDEAIAKREQTKEIVNVKLCHS